MWKKIKARFRRHIGTPEQLSSVKLREEFSALGIDVGMYSYGCFDTSRIAKRVTIGRYCSFAYTCRILTRNHGMEYISTTPYLYEPNLGLVDHDPIAHLPCVIEDDVWIGHNAIILPSVSVIGRGAIIGAGAIVTRSVDRYSIVGGNPAREIRRRFDPETIEAIERSRWWELDLEDLRALVKNNPDAIYRPHLALGSLGPLSPRSS